MEYKMTTKEALRKLLVKDNKINPEMLQLITIFVMINMCKEVMKSGDYTYSEDDECEINKNKSGNSES